MDDLLKAGYIDETFEISQERLDKAAEVAKKKGSIALLFNSRKDD